MILSQENNNHASNTSSSLQEMKEAPVEESQIITNISFLPSNKKQEDTSMIVLQNYTTSNISNIPSIARDLQQNEEAVVVSKEYFNNFNYLSSNLSKGREETITSENENDCFSPSNFITLPDEEKEELLEEAAFLSPSPFGQSLGCGSSQAENSETQYFNQNDRISLGSMDIEWSDIFSNSIPSFEEQEKHDVITPMETFPENESQISIPEERTLEVRMNIENFYLDLESLPGYDMLDTLLIDPD
ncbi:uncharacterized protein LOC129229579 [Uloborus diversus]|uniref:uncharacterized protein LOC129229579 n=1 Tax=Uloborus diversus TaxID=327109 RepID=UPI002409FD6E|nr:uncharacterized protein LOC129229579 [Uloborus diversus]